MEPGEILYTWRGESAIAYQLTGDGDRDLVYLGTWGATLEWNWRLPQHARFLSALASFSRLVLYDERGRGSSDGGRDGRAVPLEERVEDLLTVVDAANSYGPVLFGVQESAPLAVLAAATRPWAFSSLVLFDPTPTWVRTDELPWESPPEEILSNIESVRRASSYDAWTRSHVRRQLPSLVGDERAISWLAACYRAYAPPATTIAEIEYLMGLDLQELLPAISLPTLVLHRPGHSAWPSESSRYVAEHIPDAREVALPGSNSYPWVGDWESVVREVEEFVTGTRNVVTSPKVDRSVATLLFSDVVASTRTTATIGDAAWRDLIVRHHEVVRSALVRHRGVERDTAGDGFFATFDAPERALRCAIEVVESVREIGLDVRIGIHTGEVQTIDGKPGGIAVSIAARIAGHAEPGAILASSTVKDLVVGAGLEFEDAGSHVLRGVPGEWQLFRAVSA